MNSTTSVAPTAEAYLPLTIESWPRPGPTTRCSIGVSFAGAPPEREVVRRRDGEVAGDLAAAAEDGSLDGRRRDHAAVEHDGERTADVLLGDPAELARAARIEGEVDVGPAVLVETAPGIGQLGAFDQHLLVDEPWD